MVENFHANVLKTDYKPWKVDIVFSRSTFGDLMPLKHTNNSSKTAQSCCPPSIFSPTPMPAPQDSRQRFYISSLIKTQKSLMRSIDPLTNTFAQFV